MLRRKSPIIVLALIFCMIMSAVICGIVCMRRTGAASSFQMAGIAPIPDSVKNIRADRLQGFVGKSHGHTFVLQFDINRDDLSRILTAGRFVPLGWVKYNAGSIHFGIIENSGGSIELYATRWRREPSWFGLGQWKDFEAYIMEHEVPTSLYRCAHSAL